MSSLPCISYIIIRTRLSLHWQILIQSVYTYDRITNIDTLSCLYLVPPCCKDIAWRCRSSMHKLYLLICWAWIAIFPSRVLGNHFCWSLTTSGFCCQLIVVIYQMKRKFLWSQFEMSKPFWSYLPSDPSPTFIKAIYFWAFISELDLSLSGLQKVITDSSLN